MPWVRFLPADCRVEVPAGALIHDAAIRAGISHIELPCGGQGTCGLCLVEVAAGSGPARRALACQTKVTEDLTVHVPDLPDLALEVVGDSRFLAGSLPDAGALSPLFRYLPLRVRPASIEEHYSDWLRLTRALERGGCRAPITTDVRVLRGLAEALRGQGGRVVAGVEESPGVRRVIELSAGVARPAAHGLAVDLGTTTVAAQLVDLADGRILGTATGYNRQVRRGADIISRIDYARTPDRQAELRALALATINGLIGELAAEVPRERIRAACLAGNTTMIHLLLGLPPRHIREAPYVPTVNPIPPLRAAEVGLEIEARAPVHCAPGVGSYVGGDITAGLLATELPRARDAVFLFMDIGTNGEIVVGNAEWMVGCACSAGPAFEGAGIRCGMRAAPGAIQHVAIGADRRDLEYEVIGGRRPAGVCGSGLICLLGELFLCGLVDPAGHLQPERGTDRLVETDQGRGFRLEVGARTASGEDLVLSETDIANLIRTKAAIYAACSLILQNVGLSWRDIARVYIAGGFGRYLDVADAILIGMLPDLPRARFRYVGNAALTGAYLALLSRPHRELMDDLAARMTYLDLSSDPRYMESYVQATFLPHTDASHFPTVTALRHQR
ncbi:MAG: ASKHA domain-containing protein [Candidatus Methylomirabilales bacterium]